MTENNHDTETKHLLALENADTTEHVEFVKRGLNIRISELADVICGALELPWCTLKDLQSKVGITSR